MMETVWGFAALAVPAVLIGVIVLGRSRPILVMYFAAIAVGLGYLYTTGAVDDIGKQAMQYVAAEPAPEQSTAPAVAPAAETAPQEATPSDAVATPAETAPAGDTQPAGTPPATP